MANRLPFAQVLEVVQIRHQLPKFGTFLFSRNCKAHIEANKVLTQDGQLMLYDWAQSLTFGFSQTMKLLQQFAHTLQ